MLAWTVAVVVGLFAERVTEHRYTGTCQRQTGPVECLSQQFNDVPWHVIVDGASRRDQLGTMTLAHVRHKQPRVFGDAVPAYASPRHQHRAAGRLVNQFADREDICTQIFADQC